MTRTTRTTARPTSPARPTRLTRPTSTLQARSPMPHNAACRFQSAKHTFKASGACNGREVLHGTPERRHGISAIEAADRASDHEPTIHWQVSRTSAACREGPENTSRSALCGASPWGGWLVPGFEFRVFISHIPLPISHYSTFKNRPKSHQNFHSARVCPHRIPDRTFGNIAGVANRRAPDAFDALQHPVGAYGAIPIGDKRRSRQLLPKSRECDHFRSNCNSASEAEYSRQFNCTTSPLQITQNSH